MNTEKRIKGLDASEPSLFEDIISFENLLRASYQCRKGKAKSRAASEFFLELETNLVDLRASLTNNSYSPLPYHQFYVYEPKQRTITAPSFRDRVVHRAIYNFLEPLFETTYIHDSYACRIGKGTHQGVDRVTRFLRQVEGIHGKAFCLQADIQKYFFSVNRDILFKLLCRKINCHLVLNLLHTIIRSSPVNGMPLGNLTSQLFANVYLHELDFFVKHTLNVPRYLRYLDDFVLIHHCKDQLKVWKREIEVFLIETLELTTNSKTQIFPVSKKHGRALDFLGFRIFSGHRLLRKGSVNRFKAKYKRFSTDYASGHVTLESFKPSLVSWMAHAQHANSKIIVNMLLSRPLRRDT